MINAIMINGAHVIVYSKKPDLDRAFFEDILGLSHVDVGGGWLIFALPPSELAVHPGPKNGAHELYLTCDDVHAFIAEVGRRGIVASAVTDQRWGLLTTLTLPGGGKLGVYEPRHARPNVKSAGAKPARTTAAKKSAPKASKKSPVKKAPPKKAKRAVKPGRR